MMYEKRERERELHPCTCCLLGRTAVVIVVLMTFLLKGGKREPGFIPGLSVAFRNIYKQSHTGPHSEFMVGGIRTKERRRDLRKCMNIDTR
jgi:hypothetical protein